MKTLTFAIVRPIAWILVILGVLFTVLQAWLLGVPALALGAFLLWKVPAGERRPGAVPGKEAPAFAMPTDTNDASRTTFVANDADGANPFFRLHEQHTDRD